YYFSLSDGSTARLYGAGESKDGKTGVEPFTATLTIQFPTPDWAKHVVWYQIFPDRFRNGTTGNDPPHTLTWRWDWYKFAEWERPNDSRTFSGDWYSRRFGGDFQGVIANLPYFRELGVTALYFCPVFEANSYHGYDTIDYRHISQYYGVKGDNEKVIARETLDPATWEWTPSDKLFLEFVEKAHAQGLKVIVDGVFNHMGKDAFALQDVLKNGSKSTYADWFDVFDWGPPVKYRSWDGGGWMPNFRKNSDKGIASDSARKYLFDITRRWMDPNGDGDPSEGIDGWRLDVAADVPSPFWVEWRKHVKSVNPRAYIAGEHWGEAVRYLQGDQWDAVMNYQFVIRAIRYFIDQKRKISTSEFDRQMKELLALYPMQVNFVMQNLYDSHDTDRLVNMIINPDRDYDQCNRPQDGCPYNGSKPGPDAYRVLKLMATFQMTFLGAPMIWYGDEAGMFGADDPTDRKPMLWKDLQPYD
ncbi:MAG: glycoside hydrolase family 13 protein, partial [Gammaproteobacteria bacterium]